MSSPSSSDLGMPESGTSGRERRVTPRVAARFPVQLYCMGLPGPLVGRSSDVGPKGVCVETATPFDLSTLRRVVIELPEASVQCKAVGRWQTENATRNAQISGLEFEELDSDAAQRIWKFVHDRAGELALFLKDASELGPLELDQALDLALSTRVSECPAGHWIYRQGEAGRADSAFVVYHGSVTIEAESRSGRRVQLDHLQAGGVFGGLPVLAGISHVASAIASNDVVLFEVDAFTYRYLETSKPETARNIARAVLRKHVTQLGDLIERLGE